MSVDQTPKDSPTDWVNSHIQEYVETGGAKGYEWRGTTILLLTVTGRKSGTQHRTALIYREIDGKYVLVASKGGAPAHPSWYLNLTANPEVTVQIKDEVFTAKARNATAGERPGLWRQMAEVWPDYDNYQARTDREIPVVVLERV